MRNPIRVLHVVVNMNRGGAETFIMNVYRNMNRENIQFDFLTCKAGEFDPEIEALGGRIYRIPYITEAGHSGYRKALDAFFAAHRHYAIVHSHMDKMSGIVLQSAKRNGIPVRISHSHATRSEGGWLARMYKWHVGTAILSSSTHLMACSQAAAKWLYTRKAAKAAIWKNGIECERFAFCRETRERVRQELGLARGTLAVGHVGRFAQTKNHAALIDMFVDVHRRMPDSVLLLAGDGPLRASAERKVRKLGLADHVRFLGIRSDVEHVLQAFDVFVFPSLHEGMPVTLIEAQAAGLPCFVSDRVTTEVDLGLGLVRFFSLNDLGDWVDAVCATEWNEHARMIPVEALGDKGYHVKRTAKWAEGFYSAAMR